MIYFNHHPLRTNNEMFNIAQLWLYTEKICPHNDRSIISKILSFPIIVIKVWTENYISSVQVFQSILEESSLKTEK